MVVTVMRRLLLAQLQDELPIDLHHRGAEHDGEERGKETEDEREEQLHTELCGLLLGALPPFGTRRIGVGAQRHAEAGAESIGLHQHGHQGAHVVDLGAFREVLERLHALLAGARLRADELQFASQGRIGDLQFVGDAGKRLVDARASLEADDEQVGGVGQPVADFAATRVDLAAQPETYL